MSEISEQDLARVQKRFNQQELEEAVRLAFNFRIDRARAMKDEMYAEYEKAAHKGVPFREREKIIEEGKVRWSEAETQRLNTLRRNYKVLPFELWMDEGDFIQMREMGLRRFCQVNLEKIVVPLSKKSPKEEGEERQAAIRARNDELNRQSDRAFEEIFAQQ